MIEQLPDKIHFLLPDIFILPDRIREYAYDQYAAYNYQYDINNTHIFFPLKRQAMIFCLFL